MRILIFTTLFIIYSLNVPAQTDSLNFKKNAFYLEIGGVGGHASLNYERSLWRKNQFDIIGRVGLNFYNMVDFKGDFNPDLTIPFMAGVMYGRQHKAEFGFGQTFSSTIEADLDSGEPTRVNHFNTIFNLGYRYQKPGGGLLFRCMYTPIIEYQEVFYHWFGVSIGYTF